MGITFKVDYDLGSTDSSRKSSIEQGVISSENEEKDTKLESQNYSPPLPQQCSLVIGNSTNKNPTKETHQQEVVKRSVGYDVGLKCIALVCKVALSTGIMTLWLGFKTIQWLLRSNIWRYGLNIAKRSLLHILDLYDNDKSYPDEPLDMNRLKHKRIPEYPRAFWTDGSSLQKPSPKDSGLGQTDSLKEPTCSFSKFAKDGASTRHKHYALMLQPLRPASNGTVILRQSVLRKGISVESCNDSEACLSIEDPQPLPNAETAELAYMPQDYTLAAAEATQPVLAAQDTSSRMHSVIQRMKSRTAICCTIAHFANPPSHAEFTAYVIDNGTCGEHRGQRSSKLKRRGKMCLGSLTRIPGSQDLVDTEIPPGGSLSEKAKRYVFRKLFGKKGSTAETREPPTVKHPKPALRISESLRQKAQSLENILKGSNEVSPRTRSKRVDQSRFYQEQYQRRVIESKRRGRNNPIVDSGPPELAVFAAEPQPEIMDLIKQQNTQQRNEVLRRRRSMADALLQERSCGGDVRPRRQSFECQGCAVEPALPVNQLNDRPEMISPTRKLDPVIEAPVLSEVQRTFQANRPMPPETEIRIEFGKQCQVPNSVNVYTALGVADQVPSPILRRESPPPPDPKPTRRLPADTAYERTEGGWVKWRPLNAELRTTDQHLNSSNRFRQIYDIPEVFENHIHQTESIYQPQRTVPFHLSSIEEGPRENCRAMSTRLVSFLDARDHRYQPHKDRAIDSISCITPYSENDSSRSDTDTDRSTSSSSSRGSTGYDPRSYSRKDRRYASDLLIAKDTYHSNPYRKSGYRSEHDRSTLAARADPAPSYSRRSHGTGQYTRARMQNQERITDAGRAIPRWPGQNMEQQYEREYTEFCRRQNRPEITEWRDPWKYGDASYTRPKRISKSWFDRLTKRIEHSKRILTAGDYSETDFSPPRSLRRRWSSAVGLNKYEEPNDNIRYANDPLSRWGSVDSLTRSQSRGSLSSGLDTISLLDRQRASHSYTPHRYSSTKTHFPEASSSTYTARGCPRPGVIGYIRNAWRTSENRSRNPTLSCRQSAYYPGAYTSAAIGSTQMKTSLDIRCPPSCTQSTSGAYGLPPLPSKASIRKRICKSLFER